MLSLRPMTQQDLPLVDGWLRLPHVSRWWGPGSPEESLAKYQDRIRRGCRSPTHMLTILLDDAPIGWCQWYLWSDFPPESEAVGAHDGDIGIDYAIGEPARTGHGLGTMMIAALVAEVRRRHPGTGILSTPDARNAASRRVLEKNGFRLVAVRPVATEATDDPMAIYRLPEV
jgi:aminoglycoside 6'-N-acetyltransferase